MPGKNDKQFLFEVQLNWLTDKRGILTAKDAAGTLHVATPPKFGGKENHGHRNTCSLVPSAVVL